MVAGQGWHTDDSRCPWPSCLPGAVPSALHIIAHCSPAPHKLGWCYPHSIVGETEAQRANVIWSGSCRWLRVQALNAYVLLPLGDLLRHPVALQWQPVPLPCPGASHAPQPADPHMCGGFWVPRSALPPTQSHNSGESCAPQTSHPMPSAVPACDGLSVSVFRAPCQ